MITPATLDDMKIKSFWQLMTEYNSRYPETLFFGEGRLEITGEHIYDMQLLARKKQIKDSEDNLHTCYVISSVQTKGFKGRVRVHHYFDEITLKYITTITKG